MKKSVAVAGVVVVAVAAYTGVSWYVGVQAEKTIRASIERANARIIKSIGPDVGTLGARIEINDYRRGLFSTEARYAIVVQDEEERLELGMADHMQHGPFPWALVKQGVLAPQLAYSQSQLVDTDTVKRWFDAARGNMPLEVDTRIGLGGKGVSTWSFAPLEWAVEGERLSFSGGQMEIRFSNDFRDSVGEGQFASLEMGQAPDGDRLAIKEIQLQSRTTTAADETVEVHSTLEAGAIALYDHNEEVVNVDTAVVTLDSRQQADLLDATLRYDFKRVLMSGIDLGSVTLGGEIQRFHVDAFSALLAEYDAIAMEHGAGEGEEFDLTPEDEDRLLAKMRPALASSPAVALRPVLWSNEKGESKLALSANFQPLPADVTAADGGVDTALKEMQFELVLSRPMLLQAFAQTGSGEAEQKQLEMLGALMYDRYVNELEREGLLRRDGDRAVVDIVYVDGNVDVNGQSMSFEEFLGLFGAFLM